MHNSQDDNKNITVNNAGIDLDLCLARFSAHLNTGNAKNCIISKPCSTIHIALLSLTSGNAKLRVTGK